MQVCVNLRPADIQTTIKEIRPTLMCSVPRFWEKVYAGVQEKIAQESGLRKAMMLDALKVGKMHNIDYLRAGKTPPLMLHLKYKFYEKTIYALLKRQSVLRTVISSRLPVLPYPMKSANSCTRWASIWWWVMD